MTGPSERNETRITSHAAGRSGRIAALAIAAALAAGAVVYGMFGTGGKKMADTGQCEASTALASRVAPLAKGEVAALNIAKTPRPAVDIAFEGPNGPVKLADMKGKTLLVNLWATWCAPCRAEMPDLDELQAKLGGADFEVVAINSGDRGPMEKRRAFLDSIGVKHLAFYVDKENEVFARMKQAGKLLGLPVTMLIDGRGCEIGHMAGPAKWSSPDALALIRASLGK